MDDQKLYHTLTAQITIITKLKMFEKILKFFETVVTLAIHSIREGC